MSSSERALTWILRAGAVITGSAVFAIFLPTDTMASVHRGLGMGELPLAPITDYLTRSLSALYAFHGGLLLALSLDVRRFLPVIHFVGWATAALGAVTLGIDVHAGMPTWWILGEGPVVVVIGAAVAILARRLRSESSSI